MADSAAGRCLSDLSDDLLRHILSFAPASDRAATAVLSRRWLRLWRTSGDVYLDSRSFNDGCSSPDQETDAFLRGAEKALAAVAAAHGHIRRLTFSLAQDSNIILLKQSWSRKHNKLIVEHNLMESLVSNPAVRRVEELQIVVRPLNSRSTLSFGSLPSEALRVLRIVGCSTLTTAAAAPPPASAAVFPVLVELHLQRCSVPLVDLHSIIDAAPRLSTLHLESTFFSTKTNNYTDEEVVERLLIPAVSALVLADCKYGSGYRNKTSFELDVPRLQYFRYKGPVQQTRSLSLKPQRSSNMVQVDLHLTCDYHQYSYNEDQIPTPQNLFWQFIQNFNTAKVLKLKLDNFTMDDLALNDRASRDELLGGLSFDLLGQLEIEAEHKRKSMVMLGNLLHCCPMVRDLRLSFTKHHEMHWIESSIDKEAGLHFDKSVSGFRNRRRKSLFSLDRQNDDNYDASGIPGLTGEHSFRCLQNHLQRVSLQFFMQEPNCLEVQLAKFFAENAMVLQEIHIDDGCQEMLQHVNSSLRRWIASKNNGNNQPNVKD